MKKDEQSLIMPMPSSEAVNNVEIKDMSPKIDGDMDMETFLKMQKKFDELINANEIKLSSKIVNKTVLNGRERTDKTTGAPLVDDFGQPLRYPNRYIVTLSFQGGSLEYGCDENMYNELDLNSTYLFKGRIGFIKEFGKEITSPIFASWQKVF